MIQRNIANKLLALASKFPVITLTGVRQSGKSTILRSLFKSYRYVSLEDPDIRSMAEEDPRGFLASMGEHVIFDEVQRVPSLFSYIQTRVDDSEQEGMYILSGSHNFLLMESVSQSLAGRTAVLHMDTLSVQELNRENILPHINEWLVTGGFPRIYDKRIQAEDYYPSYIHTYIERDVRQLKNISNLSLFVRFLRLCAARVGQLLNTTSLANECGITVPTATSWLSILETSNIIFLLQPYYRNFNKRLVKSPKLYFCDTGLVSSLLGINSAEQMSLFYMRGELFENMVISECRKAFHAQGLEPPIYFWRDSNQNEVDLLVEDGLALHAYEIKSGATLNPSWDDTLKKFINMASATSADRAGQQDIDGTVIYGGDTDLLFHNTTFLSWKNINFNLNRFLEDNRQKKQ